MNTTVVIALTFLILAASTLYASVGHAGASAYLAAMALFSVAPEVMKPTALALNILVAAIATLKFYRAGTFSWPLFWPFVITSIPFAFIGGAITLPGGIYRWVVGVILLYAAYRLFKATQSTNPVAIKPVPLWAALLIGLGVGFLSGLTGVGGGIFLSPLLILMNWADSRQASGMAAPFILVNSAAGLLGHVPSLNSLPDALPLWAVAAAVGGWIGAEYGSRRLNNMTIRRLLALVLVVGGLKLILI